VRGEVRHGHGMARRLGWRPVKSGLGGDDNRRGVLQFDVKGLLATVLQREGFAVDGVCAGSVRVSKNGLLV
jgi:hypothetical protein